MGEKAAIDLRCADLLFEGEAEDGEEKIHSVPEVNPNRAYLPLAPDVTVAADVGKLTQPRPDNAIAYIASQAAEPADVKPALHSARAYEASLLDAGFGHGGGEVGEKRGLVEIELGIGRPCMHAAGVLALSGQ
jgi:hypothetical protein